jgi:hypothetical protein
MAAVADGYLGRPNLLNFEIFVTHDLPTGTPINQLHFDRLPTLKFFIYLKDCTAHSGAFECVPGSHVVASKIAATYLRRGIKMKDLPNFELPNNLGDPRPIEGVAGTLIIFTTDIFHRGGLVSEGQERMVIRGHSRGYPLSLYDPKPFSRQWWRESAFNPMRYVFGVIDAVGPH